jgi:hypothetical protein
LYQINTPWGDFGVAGWAKVKWRLIFEDTHAAYLETFRDRCRHRRA